VHALPFGFEVFDAQPTIQKLVAVIEELRELRRIARAARAEWHITQSRREMNIAHAPVRLACAHRLATRSAEKIMTQVVACSAAGEVILEQQVAIGTPAGTKIG